MKFYRTTLLFLALSFFVSTGFAKNIHLSKSETDWLKSNNNINMCVDPNWMPFEKIDKNGNYIGIISSYSKLIANKLHIKFHLVKTTKFTQSLSYLKQGKCDIIMSDVATPQRKITFLATKPYLLVSRAFATHNDTPWVNDFSQLLKSKQSVGVIKSYPTKDILKEMYKNIKITEFESQNNALQALSSRKIIAFVNIMPSLAFGIRKGMFNDIKISGYLKSQVKLSILVNKKLPILVPILNKTIETITDKEQIAILSRWLEVKFNKKTDSSTLKKIILIMLLILVASIIILIILKKRLKDVYKKSDEQELFMLRQGRLAQMGEMIAMIAHQWRQPLNNLAIINQIVITKYKTGKLDDKLIEYFKENSNKQIQLMSKTIDDFRNFYKEEKRKQKFMLNHLVQECITLFEPTLNHNSIELIFDSKEDYEIEGYRSSLFQSIINILNNAKDALIENNIENKKIIISLSDNYETIILSILDNAGGVPAEIIDKIFDPYFSTKVEKGGSGLGLYMTKIIIESKMKAKLRVKNEENGANFMMIFRKNDES